MTSRSAAELLGKVITHHWKAHNAVPMFVWLSQEMADDMMPNLIEPGNNERFYSVGSFMGSDIVVDRNLSGKTTRTIATTFVSGECEK